MSRTRLLIAALAAVLAAGALAVPAGAAARPRAHAAAALQIGISDNHPATFSDPRFRWLGMGIARLVVPWDIVKRRTELGWESAWLQAARAAGVKPLIVFDKDPSHPRSLPSVAAYGKAVKAFMALFPWVQDYSAWNEENHYLEPTSRDPKRAAQYFNLFAKLCPTCTVTAADVLDIGNMADWTRKFLRYARSPRYWGLHNYTDLSSGRHTRTSQFLRIVPGTVWFTETGGVVWRYEHPNSGRRGYFITHSEGYAAEVAGHLLALAHVSSRVTRVYYYQWRVPNTLAWARAHHARLSWDSGVLRPDCAIRPAFRVIARAMGKNPARAPRYKRDRAGNCLSLTPLASLTTGSSPAPTPAGTPAGGSPATKQGGAAAP